MWKTIFFYFRLIKSTQRSEEGGEIIPDEDLLLSSGVRTRGALHHFNSNISGKSREKLFKKGGGRRWRFSSWFKERLRKYWCCDERGITIVQLRLIFPRLSPADREVCVLPLCSQDEEAGGREEGGGGGLHAREGGPGAWRCGVGGTRSGERTGGGWSHLTKVRSQSGG